MIISNKKLLQEGNIMDETELRKKTETLGSLETSIISANMKFFKRNSETDQRLEDEESVLLNAVVRYFAGNS